MAKVLGLPVSGGAPPSNKKSHFPHLAIRHDTVTSWQMGKMGLSDVG